MSRDPSVPSFSLNKETAISLNIPQTDAVLINQGYSYNQAGLTYNQAGVEYGGVSGVNTDIAPIFLNASLEQAIKLSIPQTQTILYDQGYTYNQANFTYNQLGVAYGGLVQQNQDVYPSIFTAQFVIPTAIITDIYTPAPPPPSGNSGMLIGILGLTYP